MSGRLDDRAVSETLGFILTFSVVVASVGVVYTVGFGAVTDLQDAEQDANAERAIGALAESFGDVERGAAPAQAGEVRLGGSRLRLADGEEMTVSVGGGGAPYVHATTPGALVFSDEDVAVAYVSGMVVRTDRTEDGDVLGRSLVERPSFACRPEQATVSLVVLRAAGGAENPDVRTDGSVLVTGSAESRSLLYPATGTSPNASTVTIDAGAYADAMAPSMAESGWTRSGDEFTCSTERVYVTRTLLRVSFVS
ncbi:DUF7289 family protein [Halogeometricum luteum]|uniref:Flagellin N-terminal-like domain-containing protein n=1 Tax=Halogeometricum luteum TaxID=2950537 RepID=A0ABU2FX81_9EURY|nr:hypothetical protein [Halogeometricum sp. S3BR5-2]MDS0293148.1 hypothetical protein [Halogeometricum sp. S3BR5-2]